MSRKKKYPADSELICPFCISVVSHMQTCLPFLQKFCYGEYIVTLARERRYNDWSCLNCEERGLTLYPDHSKQNFGLGGPILMYVTKTLVCRTCKSDYVFSASEQKFWYETLAFNYSSFPVNCQCCRKKIREKVVLNKKLSAYLAVENKSVEVLENISGIYIRMGIEEKAKKFATLALKKKRGY